MAYGFQQFDSSGNLIVDSSASTVLLHKLWDSVTVTLYPAPSDTGSASTMTAGKDYIIVTSGTTSFTSYGASSNSVGTVFTNSGGGASGTGTISTYYGTYYRDYTLTDLSSASDLLDNYIIVRKDTGNFFSIFHNDDADHSITYQSANTVRVTYGASCITAGFFGPDRDRQCTTADVQTQTYDVFSIGKTLT